MKITFDYNNVSPNEIAKTIEHFYNTYSDLILKNNGEEIGKLDFGKINLYLSIKSSYDNSKVDFVDKFLYTFACDIVVGKFVIYHAHIIPVCLAVVNTRCLISALFFGKNVM